MKQRALHPAVYWQLRKHCVSFILFLTTLVAVGACAISDRSVTPPGTARAAAISAQAACFEPSGSDVGCDFELADLRFVITGRGDGKVYRKSRIISTFSIPLKDGYLERLYYITYRGDLLVVCEASDGESGWGVVVRLRGRDFSAAWSQHIPAFNVGPAALDETALYVTGIGFVARIDVESGAFVWKHEGLYRADDRSFISFRTPLVRPNSVWFEEHVSGGGRPPKIIRSCKSDGQLVEDTESLTTPCNSPAGR